MHSAAPMNPRWNLDRSRCCCCFGLRSGFIFLVVLTILHAVSGLLHAHSTPSIPTYLTVGWRVFCVIEIAFAIAALYGAINFKPKPVTVFAYFRAIITILVAAAFVYVLCSWNSICDSVSEAVDEHQHEEEHGFEDESGRHGMHSTDTDEPMDGHGGSSEHWMESFDVEQCYGMRNSVAGVGAVVLLIATYLVFVCFKFACMLTQMARPNAHAYAVMVEQGGQQPPAVRDEPEGPQVTGGTIAVGPAV